MVKVEFLGPINKEPIELEISNLSQLREILQKDENVKLWLETSAIAVNDKIVFSKNFKLENGDKIAETEYKFVEKKAVKHGSHMLEWDVFEAVDSNAKYKVLLMMPIHGEEELTHFHMRYGNDKEELFAKEGWFPTFVKPNTTDKQIIGEIEE